MKKHIFGAALLVAIAVAAGWNYQQNKQDVQLSDLALTNVEALASGEGSGDCKWRTGHSSVTGWSQYVTHTVLDIHAPAEI